MSTQTPIAPPQNDYGLKRATVFAVYLFGFRELPVRQKYRANKILNYILSLHLHGWPIVFSILITLLYIIYDIYLYYIRVVERE